MKKLERLTGACPEAGLAGQHFLREPLFDFKNSSSASTDLCVFLSHFSRQVRVFLLRADELTSGVLRRTPGVWPCWMWCPNPGVGREAGLKARGTQRRPLFGAALDQSGFPFCCFVLPPSVPRLKVSPREGSHTNIPYIHSFTFPYEFFERDLI